MPEIKFEDAPEINLPPVSDSIVENMEQKASKSIQQSAIKKDMLNSGIETTEGTVTPIGQPISPQVPKTLFNIGSSWIGCEKFKLSDSEATEFALHLTVIIGNVNSKVLSGIILIIMILSKITACKEAIMSKFNRHKVPEADQKASEIQDQKKTGD